MSKADRESQEKIAGIRAKATQENTAARIRSAALNRDFRVLENIQDELKESLALITPIKWIQSLLKTKTHMTR